MQPEHNPTLHTLIHQRRTLAITLAAAILVIYFGFIALVAFAPSLLATPIAPHISLGFPLGLAVILSTIALTGVYVARANTTFDRLTKEITRDTRP